jgi:hypothetical protein
MPAGNGKLMRASALEASFGKTPTVAFPASSGATSVFLSLHTADPGDDGSGGSEVSTTTSGYARQNVVAASWGAATVGANDVAVTIKNSAVVTFGPSAGATPAWGTITFLGAWKDVSSTSSANFLGRIPVSPAQVVNAVAQSVSFAIGAVTFTDNSS